MQCSAPLAQLPMSLSPLFLPLSLCHIESNGALIVEVRKNGDGRSGWAGGVDGGVDGVGGRCVRVLGVTRRCRGMLGQGSGVRWCEVRVDCVGGRGRDRRRRLSRSQCDVKRYDTALPLWVSGLPSVEGKTGWSGCLTVPLDLLEESRCGTEEVEVVLASEAMAACVAEVPASGWAGDGEDGVQVVDVAQVEWQRRTGEGGG